MSWFPFALVILGGALSMVFAFRARRRRIQAWRAVAATLGLAFRDGGLFGRAKVVGTFEGISITLDTITRGSGKSSSTYTRVAAAGPDIPGGLSLKPEGIGASFKKFFAGQDLEIQDPPYDERVLIEGAEVDVVALLNGPFRTLSADFVSQGGEVSHGAVHWEARGTIDRPDRLEAILRRSVAVAKGASLRREEAPVRLAANVRDERHPVVRARNLELLLRHYPDSSAAQEACRSAMAHGEKPLQLLAAAALSGEGREVACRLVSDISIPPPDRAAAISALGQHYPEADVVAVLEAALMDRARAVRLAALEVLGAHGHASLPRLLKTAVLDSGPLAVAAASGLGRLGDSAGESILVRLLGRSDDEARIAAAQALAVCGTRGAVEALFPLTDGFFSDRAVKEAASAAISTIQERAGGGESGQLSLADAPAEGRLSLESGPGQLSLVREEG